MRVYDVTVPLHAKTPIWDDGTAPALTADYSIEAGDFANVTSIAMGSHSGTHVDAPSHFVHGAATVDRIPAETLVGPAVVVEYAGDTHLTAQDLRELGVDGSVPRVLVKTTNGRLWQQEGFCADFLALEQSAAEHLATVGVSVVGIDYLGIEPYDAGEECPVHRTLMAAGVAIIEGMDLRDVPPGEYLLACAPLKLVGAEGAPARVFLIEL